MLPDWLKGFYTITTRYKQIAVSRGWTPPRQEVLSRYCKVQEIEPGKKYRLMFEDRNLEFVQKMGGPNMFWPAPDFDYDEPVLLVERLNSTIRVTVEKYGGYLSSDVYYFDKKIFDGVGGLFGRYVGKSVEIGVPSKIIEEEKKREKVIEEREKEKPVGVGTLVILGGLIYLISRG